ncbi:hypothetical protein GCM10010441_30370 [Kitasatospora paracochleata]|uniref:histidine kinase n=1 Tax=Kitasatospora paracochleata TaxID=58354 RepID=A0ABT1IUU1_9ACTN|nr:ATP-binding protein [Kitasatospora paracochleata]MCP2308351.1 signal transduction histidine kinase [Kitasatospora paracochleata]
MPGIPAPKHGKSAGRSGSLRTSLLPLVLVPSVGLAVAWGYAGTLLLGTGHGTAMAIGSVLVAAVLVWSLTQGHRTARALTDRVEDLREQARAVAEAELPEVVRRLQAGELLPAPAPRGPRRPDADEVEQVAEALDAVRRTAVGAVVRQAHGREGTKKVFLNIARRTQVLIHRQINMLDALEREHEEPELLRELFAVDHLATRMRRNAENLVILGGALPARRWRNAVPVVNVLRSAVSETENYARVAVQGVPRVSLSGQAVADVIHLTAELIENGTTFSPPYTQVLVSAQEVPKGLAVEVEDRGLGMSEEEYERLNAYLADPPELDVAALGTDLRLGLFVVSRLAARHDIQVTLRPSPYGGTRAVVLLPAALLEQAEAPAGIPGLPFGARVSGPAGGAGGNPALSALIGGAVESEGHGPSVGASIPGLPGAVVAAFSFPRSTAEPVDPLDDAVLDEALSVAFGPRAGAGTEPFEMGPAAPEAPVHQSAGEYRDEPVRDGGPALLGPSTLGPSTLDRMALDPMALDAAVLDAVVGHVLPAAPLALGPSAADPAGPGTDGGDVELRTPPVLPKRIRNASLADQLRESAAAAPRPLPEPAAPAEDRSPQRSRATMAAIQRGTRTARQAPEGQTGGPSFPAPDTAPSTEDPQR